MTNRTTAGRAGGKKRAAPLSANERRAIARRAGMTRWIRERFGSADFSSLGVPGGELVDAGLDALARDEVTAASLALSCAAPRLRREGVPIRNPLSDAEQRLYELLGMRFGELTHERYLACLAEVSSFADALREIRLRPDAS